MNILTGVNVPPWLVGLTRAIILAVLYAAINAAILYFSGTDIPGLAIYQPFIVLVLRQLEAQLDQATKPDSNESPPMVEG